MFFAIMTGILGGVCLIMYLYFKYKSSKGHNSISDI